MPKAKRSAAAQVAGPSSKRSKTVNHKVKTTKLVSPITLLPYLILVDILDYARTEAPILGHLEGKRSKSAWLIKTSTTCHSFYEPALSVLYRDIVLNEPANLRKLCETLRSKPGLGKYIKAVTATRELFNTKMLTKNGFNFNDFLRSTPNLKNLRLERMPILATASTPSFGSYPRGMFEVLDETNIRLKVWDWDGYLSPEELVLQQHQAQSFSTLTSLTFKQFHFTQSQTSIECEDKMLLALSYLQNLKQLKFNMAEFVTDRFMELLHVEGLTDLTIYTIPHLTSAGLTKFLRNNGSCLRSLVLSLCDNLNFEFSHVLEGFTPQLRELDFEPYVNHTRVSGETYASLLPLEAPPPTWPAYLQNLSLRCLSRWTSLECVRLLQSLLDAATAGQFAHLRLLNIWCILPELGWRERAQFREKYIPLICESFLDPTCDEFQKHEAICKNGLEWFNPEHPGSCYKVVFRVDGARPTDVQLSESHFLDVASTSVLTGRPRGTSVRRPKTTGNTVPKRKTARSRSTKKQDDDDDDDDDNDFEADELAYVDEDGEDSAWDQDD